MMKRMSVIFASLAILAIAAPLDAQFVYVGGGVMLPTGDFGDFADTGWMLAGGFGVDIGDSGLSAGLDGTYGQANESDGEGEADLYSGMAYLLYRVGDSARVGPYVFGGAGILGVDVTDPVSGDGSETEFGYQFGIGLDFPFADRVGAWVEGRFMGSSAFDNTNYFGILAGLGFGLGS